jgi:endonuclease/exonuclease/phosphatase family metal-dependent hydrolase
MSYNLYNLFDAVDDGTEYDRFDPGAGRWDEEDLALKTSRIAEVIRRAAPGGPDVVALQEVESLAALDALASRLRGYDYRILVPGGEDPVRNAVLSRLPVTRVAVHDPGVWEDLDLRDILEVEIDFRGEPLILLNVHWKSKTGGVEETEAARLLGARAVVRRLRELEASRPGTAVLVVGDFNENLDEWFQVGGQYPTAMMPAGATGGSPESIYLAATADGASVSGGIVVLYEPWHELPAESRGSYVFRGAWQTLDHMLVGPALLDGVGLDYEAASFAVFALDSTVDGRGFPLRDGRLDWRTSDHLPLTLRVTRADRR